MIKKSLIYLFMIFVYVGCVTPMPTTVVELPEPDSDKKYSSTPNFINTPKRQYKRTTRQTLSKEAQLQQEAGSLWVMQGQGSYLFAENNLRMVGDLVTVAIDGEPKKELEAKVETIASLLRRLEERRLEFEKRQEEKRLAMMNDRLDKLAEPGERAPASDKKAEEPKKQEEESQLAEFKFDIKKVPTRIRERLFNGNYQVEGSKGFLIGDKEYRVIINGIAQPEDIDGASVASSQLIEASFDIVSTLRKGSSL